jgi:dTDP-4-amino-4,6-dideoxygalactose transaminase
VDLPATENGTTAMDSALEANSIGAATPSKEIFTPASPVATMPEPSS